MTGKPTDRQKEIAGEIDTSKRPEAMTYGEHLLFVQLSYRLMHAGMFEHGCQRDVFRVAVRSFVIGAAALIDPWKQPRLSASLDKIMSEVSQPGWRPGEGWTP